MFNFREFSNIADRLVLGWRGRLLWRGAEARQRSAISRAYYAALHAARLHLKNEHVAFPDHTMDEFVWKTFSRSLNPIRARIGQEGFRLHDARKKADYADDFHGIDSKTEESL